MHFEKANYFKFLWRSHLHPGLILHPGFDTVSVVILFWHCIPVHFVVKLSSPVSVLLINSVICLVIYLIVWSRVNPPSSFFSLFFCTLSFMSILIMCVEVLCDLHEDTAATCFTAIVYPLSVI